MPRKPDHVKEMPFWEKAFMSVPEFAGYIDMGENRFRDILTRPDVDFVKMYGSEIKIDKEKALRYFRSPDRNFF